MKWIKTEEQLPTPYSYLIARGCRSVDDEECDIFTGYMYSIYGELIFEEHHGCAFPFKYITHWMYISDLLLTLPDPTDKLRPCPRCGSCDITLIADDESVYRAVNYVCGNGHKWEDWHSSEEEARKAWNEIL